jgi:hypothetical protein
MQPFACILFGAFLLRSSTSTPSGSKRSQERPANEESNLRQKPEVKSGPMLELMSMTLDNWGNVERTAAGGVRKLAYHDALFLEKSQHPAPSLMSLHLDSWGAKSNSTIFAPKGGDEPAVQNLTTGAAGRFLNPLSQMLLSASSIVEPHEIKTHSMKFLVEAPNKSASLFNLGIIAFVVVSLLMVLFYLCWDVTYDEEDRDSETKDMQPDFAAVEFTDGSWAQVYRDAQGEEKEALELLFRCNIISTDEFAFSSVSQEHIQECLWIATHMLRQKPLEEWVALWQQAQQTFEDSVTACFEARHAEDHSGNAYMHPPAVSTNLSLGGMPMSGYTCSNGVHGSIGEEGEEEEDPYTTRSHYVPTSLAASTSASAGMPSSYSQQQAYPRMESMAHTNLPQDAGLPALHAPTSQNSHTTDVSIQSRWSIESDLSRGLAMHNSPYDSHRAGPAID